MKMIIIVIMLSTLIIKLIRQSAAGRAPGPTWHARHFSERDGWGQR